MLGLLRWIARWPLPLAHAVGVALGWVVYGASSTYRQRLQDNVMGAGFNAQVRRQAVSHAGRMVAELPYLWLRPRDETLGARLVAVEGESLVQAALDAGQGLVLLSPHLGAYEVAAQAYAERFGATHPMTAMYRPARKAWLRELQLTARDRPGLLTAPASLAGIRQMIKALRRGQTVGLLPDQVPPDGMGVWAPFFGREAYTMTLAARLAQQTGAAVLLLTAQRAPKGRGFSLRYEPLPKPLPTLDDVRALSQGDSQEAAHQRACATTLNHAMETLVQRMPEQYLWGYHRHKQPRGSLAASHTGPAA